MHQLTGIRSFGNRVEHWAEKHHPKWIDVLRILLGSILFYKGIFFISNSQVFAELLRGSRVEFLSYSIIHLVIGIHVIGGLLIMTGLLTRFAVIIQIPVLLAAVFFVNLPNVLKSVNSETELSVLVLFLLFFFLIEGSGPLSVDAYIEHHREEE